MKRKTLPVGVILLVLGEIMIAVGAFCGGHLSVLEKATKICLECIGIG